eukprot:CAMPEP_0194185400 /NCGR_PEP_ID=MMETSP0154-20130528/42518_1 /TAXON_ID=1049557 /ORGANISM="Thalassiothrix antarctica, Strain L6-D1" /LENGTH=553 /DNA_ID=CAMNT_0038903715 /DNA_START=379 /DNA_END=2040 /DNA_ORIENTATION=-
MIQSLSNRTTAEGGEMKFYYETENYQWVYNNNSPIFGEGGRFLKPQKGASSHSSTGEYIGCLGYSNSQLKSQWKFTGSPPSCSYHHHGENSGGEGVSGGGSGGGGDNSSSGGSDGGGGNSGGGSGSGSGGGGGNGADDNYGGDGGGGGGDDNYGGDGEDGDDNYGGGGGEDDDYGGGGGGDDDYGGGGDGDDDYGGGGDGDDDYEDGDDLVVWNGYDDDSYTYVDPYDSFNVSQCDTYGALWLYDLSFTCESMTTYGGCECTFAQELMEAGSLSCRDYELCPRNCGVCQTCLKLLGCANGRPFSASTYFRTRNLSFYIVIAALGAMVLSGVLFVSVRRKRQRMKIRNALGEQLLDDDETISIDDSPKIWSGSGNATAVTSSTEEPKVWLAPVSNMYSTNSSITSYDGVLERHPLDNDIEEISSFDAHNSSDNNSHHDRITPTWSRSYHNGGNESAQASIFSFTDQSSKDHYTSIYNTSQVDQCSTFSSSLERGGDTTTTASSYHQSHKILPLQFEPSTLAAVACESESSKSKVWLAPVDDFKDDDHKNGDIII